MLPHLGGGAERLSKVDSAVAEIAEQRRAGNFVLPF
jgi:hypothetical protein